MEVSKISWIKFCWNKQPWWYVFCFMGQQVIMTLWFLVWLHNKENWLTLGAILTVNNECNLAATRRLFSLVAASWASCQSHYDSHLYQSSPAPQSSISSSEYSHRAPLPHVWPRLAKHNHRRMLQNLFLWHSPPDPLLKDSGQSLEPLTRSSVHVWKQLLPLLTWESNSLLFFSAVLYNVSTLKNVYTFGHDAF